MPHEISPRTTTSASKFLSLVLRHRPEVIGVQLDEQGWANIDDLIDRANRDGKNFDRALIDHVVVTNAKQRFTISDDGQSIRANQGHSINVDLELTPVEPPDKLFHGTADRFLDSIMHQGLTKRNRQHVHMTHEQGTAVTVGQRHGKPVVLTIDAAAMYADGHEFFRSANGVWLTDAVLPSYLHVQNS